jgi:hypothetical protein
LQSSSPSAPSPPAPAPARAGGPPPPPPGPPPPPMVFEDAPKVAPVPDQMTHKNPSLRAGATVPTRSDSQSSVSSLSRAKSPAPGKKPKPESMRTKKPPVKKLDGNKWIIVSLQSIYPFLHAHYFRKTLTMNRNLLKLRHQYHIQFLSAASTRPLS